MVFGVTPIVNQTHVLQQTKRVRQSLHNTDGVYVDVKWTSRTVQFIHVKLLGCPFL